LLGNQKPKIDDMFKNLNSFKEEINEKINTSGAKSSIQLDQLKILIANLVNEQNAEKPEETQKTTTEDYNTNESKLSRSNIRKKSSAVIKTNSDKEEVLLIKALKLA